MNKKQKGEKYSNEQLAQYYAEFVRENHMEPGVCELNEYLSKHEIPAVVTTKTFDDVREYAFRDNEDLADLSLNESYFTDEYFDKLEEVLRTCKKFIITTAVTGKSAKTGYFKTLLNWAAQNDAQVLILPASDIYNSKKIFRMNFDPIFKNDRVWLILNRDHGDSNTISVDETPDGYYLNKHLWLGCVKLSAKTVNPISGWDETITSKDASIIVASPRQHLKYIPSLKHKIPRAVMSTGACTVNNYKNDRGQSQKISSKAREAHQFAAVIVEIENDDIFHFRQIQSENCESFTDLYAKYSFDGNVTLAKHSTLVMGDSHAGATDMVLLKDILNKLVSYASIDEIVLHDLCDARPVSPHDRGKLMVQMQKFDDDKYRLVKLFDEIVDYLNIITSIGVRVVVVNSNHDEHLVRALQSMSDGISDFVNGRELLNMALYYLDHKTEPLLQYCINTLANKKLEHPELIKWLALDESYVRYGCELGQHGHLGANGSRGSLKQTARCVGNAIIGHSHSAGIIGKTFQVGTTSELDQGYNVGLSSWTRTCALLHEDGTKQLINFIPNSEGGYNFHIED